MIQQDFDVLLRIPTRFNAASKLSLSKTSRFDASSTLNDETFAGADEEAEEDTGVQVRAHTSCTSPTTAPSSHHFIIRRSILSPLYYSVTKLTGGKSYCLHSLKKRHGFNGVGASLQCTPAILGLAQLL
jgi:hypothetical protein